MNDRWWRISKWFFGIILGIFLLISGALAFFKDDIIQYVVSEINKHLQAKVRVEKVDLTFWSTFPNVSVDFDEVFISDALPNATDLDTLLYSQKIQLKFNPIDLWNEKYDIQKINIHTGTLRLKVDSLEQVNYAIFKTSDSTETSDAPLQLDLKNVQVEGLKFSYINEVTKQTYRTKVDDLQLKGNFNEEVFYLQATSDLYLNEVRSDQVNLVSNQSASFDLSLRVDQKSGSITIPKARLLIAQLPFQIEGKVDTASIRLKLDASQLPLKEVASKLALQQLDEIDRLQGSGYADFHLLVAGPLGKTQSPTTDCRFSIRQGSLVEPSQNLRFTNIQLEGTYTNRGGTTKSVLDIPTLKFQTASGPFSAQVRLTQFAAPRLVGKANGKLDLASIHAIFRLPYVENIQGNLGVNSVFDVQFFPQIDGSSRIQLHEGSGNLNMQEIQAKILDDSRKFKSINGFIGINGDEASLDNVRIQIGKSDFAVNGVFENIIPYLEKSGNLKATVDLKSQEIHKEDLSDQQTSDGLTNGVFPQKSFIFPDNIDGGVSVRLGKFIFENHVFSQIISDLTVSNRKLDFAHLQFENASARISGKLSLLEQYPEFIAMQADLRSDEIQFKSLFQEWNNFDQNVILAENIAGKASVAMQISAPFDLSGGIHKSQIAAKIHIKILDGRLHQVSTFKTITESLRGSSARMVLKKQNIQTLEKNLLDLRFKTLENTLYIKNGKLEIPLMTIESNALNLEVFGFHSFENDIDYHFAFRLRDLIQKERETEFGTIQDDGTGVRIFMRMYGNLSNPTIEWDEEAKKQQAKENREQAKQEALSILKTEFGWKKGDTTIRTYQSIKKPSEKIEMDFGNDIPEPIPTKKENEKVKKMKEKLQKIKEESQQKVEYEIGD